MERTRKTNKMKLALAPVALALVLILIGVFSLFGRAANNTYDNVDDFTKLQDAITAINGFSTTDTNVINITADIAVTEPLKVENNVTINGSSNTLSTNTISTSDSGAIIEIYGNSTVVINDLDFNGIGHNTYISNAISMKGGNGNTGGQQLTVNGGTIQNFTSSRGAVRLIDGSAILQDVTIQNNGQAIANAWGGGVTIESENYNTIVTINGCTIIDNVAERGAGIYATDSGCFVSIIDTIIARNTATVMGGGINIYAGAEVTLGTGTIVGKTDSYNGNTAPSGAGVAVTAAWNLGSYGAQSALIMEGNSRIFYNTSTINNDGGGGGGVYAHVSTVTLNDTSSISNNVAVRGGGVYMADSASSDPTLLVLNGGTIDTNTAHFHGGGIYTRGGNTITLGGGSISGNYTEMYGGGIYTKGSTINISDGSIFNNNADYGHGGGIYSNGSSITMDGGSIAKNRTEGGSGGGGIYATNGSTIELKAGSIVGDVSTANGNTAVYGGGIALNAEDPENGYAVSATSTLTINGGIVSGNTATAALGGGGIYSNYGNTVTLNSGSITGNTATNAAGGGGGYAGYNNANFVMDGGSVSDNGAANGAGIYEETSNFTMNDGEIYNNIVNTISGYGGGIHHRLNGTVAITGGRIYGNRAGATSGYGGGLYLYNNSITVNITGGVIGGENFDTDKNYAGYYGGGIFSNACNINFTGGTIIGNEVGYYGGGVYTTSARTFTLGASGSIVGNKANRGAGVYVTTSSIMTMNGGSISKNFTSTVATTQGGGIHIANNAGAVSINGGTISENKAALGGGIYAAKDFTLGGGTFSENIASVRGGALYLTAGVTDVTATNIIFDGNKAGDFTDTYVPGVGNDGGAVYTTSLAAFKTSGTTVFRNNEAPEGYLWDVNDLTLENEPDITNAGIHLSNILSTGFTAPFTNAYNNYDINYFHPPAVVFREITVEYYKDAVVSGNLLNGSNVVNVLEGATDDEVRAKLAEELGSGWLNLYRPAAGYEAGAAQTPLVNNDNVVRVLYLPTQTQPPIVIVPDPTTPPEPTATPEAPTPTPSETPTPTPRIPVETPTPPPGNIELQEDGSYIEFGDDGAPLGEWRWDEDLGQWIFDEYPPLGALETGDASGILPVALVAALAIAAIAVALPKKKRAK
jgi:hypothetical protein